MVKEYWYDEDKICFVFGELLIRASVTELFYIQYYSLKNG